MPRPLKIYIIGVVIGSAVALLVTTLSFGVEPEIAIGENLPDGVAIALGIGFWLTLTLAASAIPVRMPRGTLVAVSIAPILAAIDLGGPTVGVWLAAIGTTELRELRGKIPWYGTLSNHAGTVIPAALAGIATYNIGQLGDGLAISFVGLMVGAGLFIVANFLMASVVVALRTGQSVRIVLIGDLKGFGTSILALAPLAWLMARVYELPGGGWWAVLLFALPLY